jgi:hypothetical protein
MCKKEVMRMYNGKIIRIGKRKDVEGEQKGRQFAEVRRVSV